MNTLPSPALVTRRAAQRLPRLALLLFCAAYVLPGMIGRDPWRNADVTAFGYMVAMAEGRTSWLAPTLGQLPLEQALLPHWIGAAFIAVLAPAVEPTLAARLPFALMLTLVLALVWYATFQLARTEAAQPVAFAFGGEAEPVDYARAVADGAVLALTATLGLLQLGHETTPELAQLTAIALFQWSLAAAPFRRRRARVAVVASLPLLAASGAPTMAVAVGAVGVVICLRSAFAQVRLLAPWVIASVVAAAALATLTQTWSWRWRLEADATQAWQLARLWLWFLWPAWLLAMWTAWRWRQHLFNRHISVPLAIVVCGLVASAVMGGNDRALMLALPGVAVLAAFALPTLQRSTAAAIDWFSVFFFTAGALAIWVIYSSMHTGMPAKPAANVARLATGFQPSFSWLALLLAVLGTLAWLWLVRWRTARHQSALWKSLVLPAGGVALGWLLLMTLLLPVLDYARSDRALVQRIAAHVPRETCIAAPDVGRPLVAALEYHGRWSVDARADAATNSRCAMLVMRVRNAERAAPPPAPWQPVARVSRPTERVESFVIYRRDRVATR